MICLADNTNRAIMTNDGVRGESGISCPDNIETKTAISVGGDVIHSYHYFHPPPPPPPQPTTHQYRTSRSLLRTNHHNGSTQWKLV